jgi:murein DD-endopeptidase MepM/ murein hydrolase activator NlpD
VASWWEQYILQRSRQLGLDPRAVRAVASVEGLSGAVGDQGTSYGPFQLHRGGALPSGRGRQWAESKAGIDYALRQIQGVAGGMTGQQAVANIVRRFERPADPTGEIARALAAYGGPLPKGGAGGAPAAIARLAQGGPPTRAAGKPRGFGPQTVRQFDPGLLSRGIFSALATGGTPDIGALTAGSWKNVTLPGLTLPPLPGTKMTKQGKPTGPPPMAGMVAVRGGWAIPGRGKVIGTPGAGTHTLGNWESDRALDIAMKVGSPVYAPFGGMVGSQFGSLGAPGSSRFAGLRLHIASPKNEWYGAHLSRFAPGIKPGVRVRPGQLIGYSGSASGVGHLHEALKYGDPYRLI